MYEEKNLRAISRGESHLKQTAGVIRRLRGDLEDKLANGVVLHGVGPKSHRGLTLDQRRQTVLDELVADIDTKETVFRELGSLVEDLKETVEKHGDSGEEFYRIMCHHNRAEIARITGSDPRIFVNEE